MWVWGGRETRLGADEEIPLSYAHVRPRTRSSPSPSALGHAIAGGRMRCGVLLAHAGGAGSALCGAGALGHGSGATVRPAPSLFGMAVDAPVHSVVHARRLAAPGRQRVVPGDLRFFRGTRAGRAEIPAAVP